MHGTRIRAGGNVGTVRWGPAPLPGQQEDILWFGVEYDEPVGKHQGTSPDGVQRFECGPNKGAFVKVEKVDKGVSFGDALGKYKDATEGDMSLGCGRDAEFVGRDQVLARQGDVSNLENVALDEERISSSLCNVTLTNVRSLSMNLNLLSSWDVIHEICSFCPALEYLSLVSNRLLPSWDTGKLRELGNIKSLIVRDTNIDQWEWPHAWFPNCEELNLGKNNVGATIPTSIQFPHLKILDVNSNEIGSWSYIEEASRFPALEELILNECSLPSERPSMDIVVPPRLRALSIYRNDLSDWSLLGWLSDVASHITDLRVMHNPIGDGMGEYSKSACRQLCIALWPDLTMLNASVVSANERVNSERFFLSLVLRDADVVPLIDPQSVHRKRLEEKHGGGVVGHEDPNLKHNLASQLIEVKLQPDGKNAHKDAITRKIPATMVLRDLKMLCKRLFKMNDLRMAFVDPEMPMGTSFPLDDEFREVSFFGIRDGYEIRVEEV